MKTQVESQDASSLEYHGLRVRSNRFVDWLGRNARFSHLLHHCLVDGVPPGGSLATVRHLIVGMWPPSAESIHRALKVWARRRFRGGRYNWTVSIVAAPPGNLAFAGWKPEHGVAISVTSPEGAILSAWFSGTGGKGRVSVFLDSSAPAEVYDLQGACEAGETVAQLEAVARGFILSGVMLPAARGLAGKDTFFTMSAGGDHVRFVLRASGAKVEILPPVAGCTCVVKVDGAVVGEATTGAELTALLEPHASPPRPAWCAGLAAWTATAILAVPFLGGCAYHTTRSYSNATGMTPVVAAPAPVVYDHYRVIPRYPDYPPYRRDSLALYRID